MAFGSDGLLYVVAGPPNNEPTGFVVYALDENGIPQKSWTNTNAKLNDSKIAFDTNGYFYVSTLDGLHKFEIASSNADTLIFVPNFFPNVTGVDVLPNNELLVASHLEIYHIDSFGNIIASMQWFDDPNGVLSPDQPISHPFYGTGAIAYDASSNTILESPRFYRRVFSLSQATMADPSLLS